MWNLVIAKCCDLWLSCKSVICLGLWLQQKRRIMIYPLSIDNPQGAKCCSAILLFGELSVWSSMQIVYPILFIHLCFRFSQVSTICNNWERWHDNQSVGMPLTICKTKAHELKSSNSIHVENCYFNSGRLAGLVHYRERDSQGAQAERSWLVFLGRE